MTQNSVKNLLCKRRLLEGQSHFSQLMNIDIKKTSKEIKGFYVKIARVLL